MERIFADMSQAKENFGQYVLDFYRDLQYEHDIPPAFEMILPFNEAEVRRVMKEFYKKYYPDNDQRIFLYGINPGRFGAGVTGISFTDPWHLQEKCDIPNGFPKRKEISSEFIYKVVEAWGGPAAFFRQFFITSICPIGFLKDGKNANYYDDKELEGSMKDQIRDWMATQLSFGARRDVAFSIGQGTNFKVLERLNKQYGFFEEVRPLPHPRWVMQYRRKKLDIFVDQYVTDLSKVIQNEQ
jgi:hypothetical protein